MTYRRFEDLPVWNDAIDLAIRIFALTSTGRLKGFAGLRDQIERAVVSISNNIAEGFERGTNNELLGFLYIARGSAGEVRSMLCLLARLNELADLKEIIEHLRITSESVSRQLGRWIETIKDSGFEGSRSRNEKTRSASRATQRRDDFLAELKRVQDEARSPQPAPSKDEPNNP
jgi:four helix bundle protein